MSNYARYRDWHMWIGLILLIPLSVIAATGFLWNHEKALGIKREEEKKDSYTATKADPSMPALVLSPRTWSDHGASIDAALAAASKEWGSDVPLERIELKDEPGYGLVVKVKAPEDSDVKPYEIVWSASTGSVIEKKGDPRNGTDWAKVVHDLHTGKFFSKQFGFIWSDSSALAILALGITGVVLYLIPVLKKRAKKKRIGGEMVRPATVPLPSRPVVRPATSALSVAVSDSQS
jgi:uncharacterized iron-regulated membrane protein